MARGRPRAFDTEGALDCALHMFWERGFEGTSVADLTEAMGINPPSLYAAFGNKEELFIKILDRYAEGPAIYMREAFAKPTVREVVEGLLYGAAEATTNPATPLGCLTVQGGISSGASGDAIKQELSARRAGGENALKERFEHAKINGEIPTDVNAEDLASFYVTVFQGMAVQAGAGGSREKLIRIATNALRLWPS
ncbi:TetR/AcrR family transcriptional regulator [Paenibacillus psychroresistens]|uniref:TetR/AcrR family transcriptional regulator n=1 Tax=Paenibacillus psychroresistens TaxID=1778678 RepID=A0A6B8RUC6_9BACL|nr:TetR/AcrR family transcriptional regulator [Paenibacillus psychroresistens]QGQ98768.1 TetR/AcrR family transcriptional regulator [Paenibacillus psychroresistens]